MPDARFPDRWLLDRRLDQLSDRDFRSFSYSIMWSVANMTDGVIEPTDLKLIPHFMESSVGTFLQAGLWEVMDDSLEIRWQICDYGVTQTSRDEHVTLANFRRREREHKAKQRLKKASQ